MMREKTNLFLGEDYLLCNILQPTLQSHKSLEHQDKNVTALRNVLGVPKEEIGFHG